MSMTELTIYDVLDYEKKLVNERRLYFAKLRKRIAKRRARAIANFVDANKIVSSQ